MVSALPLTLFPDMTESHELSVPPVPYQQHEAVNCFSLVISCIHLCRYSEQWWSHCKDHASVEIRNREPGELRALYKAWSRFIVKFHT